MSMIQSTCVPDALSASVSDGTAMCRIVMSITTGRKASITAARTSHRCAEDVEGEDNADMHHPDETQCRGI